MIKKLSISLLALLLPTLIAGAPAQAAITLYDKDDTTFSTDGSFNTFYVYSDSDNEIAGTDRQQSRVKMGFLPNWIGFNFGKKVGNLKLGGRSSFWVTINDSDSNLTSTGIDVRQFYGTVEDDWGQVLIGKDFTLFNRSNIFLDEILLGYGNVSDTLGLIDGTGVSFGNIGTGYTYPLPSAQITYRSPTLAGFKLAVGVVDPSRTTKFTNVEEVTTDDGDVIEVSNVVDNGEEKAPRLEGELTYNFKAEKGDLTAWTGFLYQKSESDTAGDITSKGVSYGIRARYAGVSLHASGYDAEGVGLLLGPGGDAALGLTGLLFEAGDEVDTNGYLLQASYTYGPVRVVGSFGASEVETITEWENETTTGAVFYNINDNLKLVAEYNVNEISIGTAEEETNTIALGGIINF